jgi:RecB family exonuclease
MSNISYRPLIEDMVWSYSRIETYNDCPYRFFLRYIRGYEDCDKFYATYGSFMHKILERFYKKELSKNEMVQTFLLDFSKEVRGFRPEEKTVQKYIQDGCAYLREFEPLPFNMIDVEKRVEFSIGKYKFVGFIDYLGEKDGGLYIVDNKSRNLKPRTKKSKPTLNDKELDQMLRQLYLYSVAVEQQYGELPEALCFNCFRTNTFIKEQFDIQKYEETKKWAIECIEKILETDEFVANQKYFSCTYICGVNDHCEYDIEAREERRFES